MSNPKVHNNIIGYVCKRKQLHVYQYILVYIISVKRCLLGHGDNTLITELNLALPSIIYLLMPWVVII